MDTDKEECEAEYLCASVCICGYSPVCACPSFSHSHNPNDGRLQGFAIGFEDVIVVGVR
jgi:hypothetical protein